MKPPPNKRVSSTRQRQQQHLLDVTIRLDKERARRFRSVAGGIFKTALILALLGGIWVGGKEGLRRWVWENPALFVHAPRVTTDGTLTIEQVLTATDLAEPRNILAIDLGKVRKILEKLPQVENVEVQRTLPNQLAINITERRPIAWVIMKKDEDPTTSDRSFLIDARSVVLRSRVLQPEYYHLPVITGVETENLVPGQRVNLFDVQAALGLVRLNANSNRFQIRHIDLSIGYGLLVSDQRRAKITFGFENIEGQLARLYQLLDVIEPTLQEIRTINLIAERNVPVTFYKPTEEMAEPEPVIKAPVKAAVKVDEKESRVKSSPARLAQTVAKSPPAKIARPAAKSPPARPSRSARKVDAYPARAKAEPSPTATKPSPLDRLKKRFDLNG